MAVVEFALCLIGGVFLYWLRNHSRLTYGLLQLAVAVLLLVAVCFNVGVGYIMVGGEGFLGDVVSNGVALFAGLYAMVQGLENVVTALREPGILRSETKHVSTE